MHEILIKTEDIRTVRKIMALMENERKLAEGIDISIENDIECLKNSLKPIRASLDELIVNDNDILNLQSIIQDEYLGREYLLDNKKNLEKDSKKYIAIKNIISSKKLEHAVCELWNLGVEQNNAVVVYFLLDFEKYLPPHLKLEFIRFVENII